MPGAIITLTDAAATRVKALMEKAARLMQERCNLIGQAPFARNADTERAHGSFSAGRPRAAQLSGQRAEHQGQGRGAVPLG